MERPSKRPRSDEVTKDEDHKDLDADSGGYTGYCLPSSTDDHTSTSTSPLSIDCLSTMPTDAKQFFKEYIQTRKPVKIQNALVTAAASSSSSSQTCELRSLLKWRDHAYLQQQAGKAMVHVERRPTAESRFGRARDEGEVQMTFGEFLNTSTDSTTMSKEDRHLYYLTTQPILLNEEGRPFLMSEPVTSMQQDFPLRPSLAGNLIPMNYNLWMGASGSSSSKNTSTTNGNGNGSTSGLHHDFHDNFYYLLEGRKKFVLYSPDRARDMKTRGTISKVHANGLINYSDTTTTATTTTSSDGVEDAAMHAWSADKRKQNCEQEVADAEAAIEAGAPKAEERLETAEAALEEALEAVLQAEMLNDDDSDDDDDDELDNDDDDDDDFWSKMQEKKETGDNTIEKDEEEEDDDPKDEENQEDDDDEDDENQVRSEKLNNFSQIETTPVAGIPYAEVFLEAGDLLYLPAGWFHEVTSYSNSNSSGTSTTSKDEKKDAATHHMAFNYWFHPPSSASTTDNFENPYPSRFWKDDWEQRMEDKKNINATKTSN
jgi:hypothetical protein